MHSSESIERDLYPMSVCLDVTFCQPGNIWLLITRRHVATLSLCHVSLTLCSHLCLFTSPYFCCLISSYYILDNIMMTRPPQQTDGLFILSCIFINSHVCVCGLVVATVASKMTVATVIVISSCYIALVLLPSIHLNTHTFKCSTDLLIKYLRLRMCACACACFGGWIL